MKTKLIFLALTLFVGVLQTQSQVTLSHHVDPVTVDVSGLSCTSSFSHFARVYNLNEFGVTGEFLISEVEIGLGFDHGNDGKIVIINVYTSDSEDLTTATLTLVSTKEIILQASNLSLLSVPLEANIPAGSIVVVETFAPADSIHYHPGFNLYGHSGTAWVKVPNCGIPNWTDTINAPEPQHILINIVGTEILSVNDNVLENVTIYPNPTVGDFTIDFAKNYDVVDVSVTNILGQRVSTLKFNNTDSLELTIDGKAGIYFVTISISNGISKTIKVIKQ